jgi:hypothetical protein
MTTLAHRRIFAIATAVVIGLACDAALARGGGGLGGHVGGFGASHVGGFNGLHVGGLGSNFAGGHSGGLAGGHSRVFGAAPIDRLGIDSTRMLGHTHISHELRHHHFDGLYGWSRRYYSNDCPWPADLTIESCPGGLDTE